MVHLHVRFAKRIKYIKYLYCVSQCNYVSFSSPGRRAAPLQRACTWFRSIVSPSHLRTFPGALSRVFRRDCCSVTAPNPTSAGRWIAPFCYDARECKYRSIKISCLNAPGRTLFSFYWVGLLMKSRSTSKEIVWLKCALWLSSWQPRCVSNLAIFSAFRFLKCRPHRASPGWWACRAPVRCWCPVCGRLCRTAIWGMGLAESHRPWKLGIFINCEVRFNKDNNCMFERPRSKFNYVE